MKAFSLRLWMTAAILPIIFFFITPAVLIAQPGSPCKCEDKADLLNQLQMANAALNKIQQYLKTVKPTEMVNDFASAPNPTGITKRVRVFDAIAEEMRSVEQKDAHAMIFIIDNETCKVTSAADTPCLKSLIDQTLLIKQELTCERGKNGSLSDYLRGLSEVYNYEIAQILKRLSVLPKSCRPDNWFGTIRYSYFRKDYNKDEKPGIVHTIEDILTIDGIIRLDGFFAYEYPSSWEAGGKYVENKESNGMRPCIGGLKPGKADTQYQTKFIFKWDKSGSKVKDTEVTIGEPDEGSKIPIGFRIPEITVKTSGYKKGSSTSGCPKPNGDFDGPPEPWDIEFPLDSQKINFIGSYFLGNPEKISGSETLESGKTGTVVVTYSLYKFKR